MVGKKVFFGLFEEREQLLTNKEVFTDPGFYRFLLQSFTIIVLTINLIMIIVLLKRSY